MTLTLREIEKATGGKLKGADCTVAGFTIDSREVPNEGLYIAIKGDRFDGHDFCAGAVKNGACAVVCERDPGFSCRSRAEKDRLKTVPRPRRDTETRPSWRRGLFPTAVWKTAN